MVQRPSQVQDALEIWDGGLTVGRYGDTLLFPAYQPIYQVDGDGDIRLAAFEGLVRPFVGGKLLNSDHFFHQVGGQDRLFVECMCQAVHIRNYHFADPTGQRLFVNINPANYESMEALKREFLFLVEQFPKYGLRFENVVFELLETAPYSQEILLWLRHMASDSGIQFAMDDFGDNHSNIERYQTLRPDIVKIDRAYFLQAVEEKACYRLMINLIHQFHCEGAFVVIEGIETVNQLDMAISLGADFVQGYHLERPQVLPHKFETTVSRSDTPHTVSMVGHR